MSNPVLQFGDASYWTSVYSNTFVAEPGPDSFHHKPMKELLIPIIFNRHIIAIDATSDSALESWYTAGLLKQYIRTGIVVGGRTDSVHETRKIYLKNIQVIYFKKIIKELTQTEIDYTIGFVVPRWLKDITLTFWQYTGVELDTTENLIGDVGAYIHQKL
jgi:hypothetical protein